MLIALVSLDQQWLNKKVNFARCAEFVSLAAARECELVVFPEMTLTGYSMETEIVAEPINGSDTLRQFGDLAREHSIDVVFGAALTHVASRRPRNTLCIARRSGRSDVVYAKTHPFTFAGEDKVFETGNAVGIAKIGGFHIGCSVCYDLRFPELFSAMAGRCDAVLNIASWPATRVAHWRSLLVARAIENQLFVFGVNRIGVDGNSLGYEKSSMAVSPNGSVLTPISSAAEIDVYDCDLRDSNHYRSEFPTVNDKRFSLYAELFQKQC